jgi:hypothetical protein
MKCVITLSRSLPPRGWIRQRYREFLSFAAQDRPFANKSSQTAGAQPAQIRTSPRTNCNPTSEHGPLAHPSELCMLFNTHRPAIFGRFSPIRL